MGVFQIPEKEGSIYQPRANELFNVYGENTLSASQKSAGVVANVRIIHPTFTANVSVFKSQFGVARNYVSEPSVIVTDDAGKKIRRVYLQLNDDVKNYIVNLVKDYKRVVPNYLSEQVLIQGTDLEVVTSSDYPIEHEELGIKDIVLGTAYLSESQNQHGVMAKANIVTTIGTLRGITIFEETQIQALRLSAPTEGENVFYTLTEKADRHIKRYCHSKVDWSVKREWKPKANIEAIISEMTEDVAIPSDFTPETVLDESAIFGA